MIFGFIYLATMIGLLIFMNFALKNRTYYAGNMVNLLRYMILLLYWVFYMPFFESFISIFNCSNGTLYIDPTVQCFQGIHIFYVALCIIFLVILFSIGCIVAMLFNETQPTTEDCLCRMETSFEFALVVYRSGVAIFTSFCFGTVCSWLLIMVYLLSSGMVCFQYYKQIPYYNQFFSIYCGTLIFSYFWIALNAVLMMLLSAVSGHIIIIFGGIPLIWVIVKNLRESRIESLAKTNIEKVGIDIDALI